MDDPSAAVGRSVRIVVRFFVVRNNMERNAAGTVRRMRRIAFIVLGVAAVLGLAACGSGDGQTAAPPPVDTTQQPPAQGGGEDEGVRGGGGGIVGAKVGQPVPDIVGTTLDGKELSLAGLRGTKVIVNLWSSW